MAEYRLARLLSFLTLFLIMLGGFVHNTGSSLACPDWPLCYGTLFPAMTGGVQYEHSHRVLAAAIGLLIIALTVLIFRRRPDPASKILSSVALFLVVFQGILGGLTVIYRLPMLVSVAHLATSMIFFLLMVTLTHRLSPAYQPPVQRRCRVTALVALAVYLQMLLGALVRHTGSGLACLEIPLCQGSLWPAGASGVLQLHMAHRIGALIVATLVLLWSVVAWCRVKRVREDIPALFALPFLLVLLEVTLGLLSVATQLGIWSVTFHLGVGAALLASLWWLFLNSGKSNS